MKTSRKNVSPPQAQPDPEAQHTGTDRRVITPGFFFSYAAADVLMVGVGMGVPIVPILAGFPLGWHLAGKAHRSRDSLTENLRTVMRGTLVTAGVTLLLMLAIWGRMVVMINDPIDKIANFGHPMILYEPRLSFIGWLVLMIVVSPVLQALATVFAGNLRLLRGRWGTDV